MERNEVADDAFKDLEAKSAQEVLAWALERYHPRLAFASSFGAEDVVVIDMLARIRTDARIFTLDTGRLHEETYEVMEAIRKRYGVTIESYFPERAAVETLEREKGLYSFRESIANRKECCTIRKVEPLNRALSGLDAWVSGLRRDQAVTRGTLAKIEPDAPRPGLTKINPIADWSVEDVWAYIKDHDVLYNKLYDRSFPLIGCSPCTRPVAAGEDIRAGRWWWELPEQKECGLHVNHPARAGESRPGANDDKAAAS